MNLPNHRHPASLGSQFAHNFELFRVQYQLYTAIIFDNLDIFKETFLEDETVWDVVDVCFDANGIKFVWVAWEGNHIVSEIAAEEFEGFLNEVEKRRGQSPS